MNASVGDDFESSNEQKGANQYLYDNFDFALGYNILIFFGCELNQEPRTSLTSGKVCLFFFFAPPSPFFYVYSFS